MSEPCGDITCGCHYPEFQHHCEWPDASDGDVHPCPDCGAVWAATGFEQLPPQVQARIERNWQLMAAPFLRWGREPPARPTVSWRQLVPASRIPGSEP